MPVDPHLGSDWTSAATDPTAELVALRRDVRRVEAETHVLNGMILGLIDRIERLETRHADT